MNTTITKTPGNEQMKKIAILDHNNNKLIIRSIPESAYMQDDIEDWLSENNFDNESEYMVGDFEIDIDN